MRKNKQKYNDIYIRELMQQYEDMAVSMIKWEGLPSTIPDYMPERTLYRQGQCCAFIVPGTDELGILPVAYGSVNLDIYGNPMEWKAYAVGSSPIVNVINNMQLNTENSVILWNNQTRTGDAPYIERICKKMVALDDTLDINCLIQRTPVIFKANGKNLLTVKNIMEQYSQGNVAIVDSNYEVNNNTDILNLGVQFIGAELSDQYETYHDRILRYFGIDYLPVEKQERMLTGEANSNEQELLIRRKIRLTYREKACKQIKEVLGVEVSVSYVEPEPEPANTPDVSRTSGYEGGASESESTDN